jgi:hypothetical protein
LTSNFEVKYLHVEASVETREEVRKMIPSSWYRMAEIKGRDEELRRAAARHRDIGPLRRRIRLRRHD